MTSESELSSQPPMETASTTTSQSSSAPPTHSHSFPFPSHRTNHPTRSATTPGGPPVTTDLSHPGHNSASSPSPSSFGRRFFRSRSRSRSPAPIDTRSSHTRDRDHPDNSAGSPATSPVWPNGRCNSPPGSAVSSPTSPDERKPRLPPARKSSGSSDYRRLSGTVNHCGRHSNDWLFGGFSVRESVGKLWRESPTPDGKEG